MRRLPAMLLAFALALSVPAAALTDEEMDAKLYEAGTAALSECLDESMTDVEKLTALHDWMSLHCEYGPAPRSETAFGALVNGTAVCVGYAEGYAYLATLAGLDGAATYSKEMDHAWILVTVDGERYFSDCTWDDGKHQKLGLIRHKYWLFDEENAEERLHYGWDSEESVPGGPLEDAPWNTAVTQVIFTGDRAYYIDAELRLMRCDRASWDTEELLDLRRTLLPDGREEVWGPDPCTSLILIGDRLFFNTPDEICSVGIDGGGLQTVGEPETEGRAIFGIVVIDGELYFSLADSPDAVLYDVVALGRADALTGEAAADPAADGGR